MNKTRNLPARTILIFLLVFAAFISNQLPAQTYSKQDFATDYREYLVQEFPARFTELTVAENQIDLKLKIRHSSRYDLEDLAIAVLPTHIPSQRSPIEKQILDAKLTKNKSEYSAIVARISSDGSDRSHCRFVLVRRTKSDQWLPLSASVYPNVWQLGTQRDLERLAGRDQKGLGGIPGDAAKSDHQIYDLGLSHATINIVLNGMIRLQPENGFEKWNFEGRDVFVNESQLLKFDQRLERLREKKIVVSMILLVRNQHGKDGKITDAMVHPEAGRDGKFAMPNLATPTGAFLYRAIIHQLAERYTREGPTAGRVSNWIIHNEIDQSGTWTTMGEQPIERYMEMYVRSARVVHQTTRQFDPGSRVFISLTHHWNKISAGKHVFRVRDVIEYFAKASLVEGDFEWGVAYHPYPQNLADPRCWNDQSATFDFDTPFITPRNIEVLPAYLDQQHIRFLGKYERPILLSEQGCSAQSMSLSDQKIQAAGIVYMFNRIRHLPTVEAFHYHAYRDSPDVEGGARFGLVDEYEKPKFAWQVYQSLNSEYEKQATEFAWSIMGADAADQATKKMQIDTEN